MLPTKPPKSPILSAKQIKAAIILLLFFLLCTLPILKGSLTEDISTMIPQGDNDNIRNDFKLLQKSPLSGKVLISISSSSAKPELLIQIADSIASKMTPPYLVIQDYSDITPQSITNYLLRYAPRLTDNADLKRLKKLTSNNEIDSSLVASKKQLLSPAGLGMKDIIAADPLNLRSIYLRKISLLQNLPRFNMQGKHLFNKDKTALLLIAKSEIPMTDSKAGAKLLSHFKQIKNESLKKYQTANTKIEINLISGHIYTDANASIIKKDILTVSAVSLGALLLLFLVCFRHGGALTVFLAPAVAIIAGFGVTSLVFKPMSSIVIGFGAVLMGISIDFAVHTYFALADNKGNKDSALQTVISPILFGAATSCAAFAALYVSGIPGIRQLAVFSVTGIVAACGYSLLFIPNFCNYFPVIRTEKKCLKINNKHKPAIIISAILILTIGLSAAFSSSFDTELKKLGYISSEIKNSEQLFHKKWGNLHGQSMLFSKGATLDEALQNSGKALVDIWKNMPETKVVNLTPMFPAASIQNQNLLNWNTFWTAEKIIKTAKRVDTKAQKLGFASKIFDKTIHKLTTDPPEITLERMNSGPLEFLSELLIPKKGYANQKLVMTLLPETRQILDYYTPVKEHELNARLVSQSKFKAELENEMKKDIIKFICFSGLLVALLIFLLFRDMRRSALAIAPVVFGVITTFGALGLLDIPLNIFHIVALPLVIGLGADYGIFMVFQEIKTPSASTVKAVKISGLTTLAGFGVLIFAKHPSLHSLGATVSIGVSAALICAVFILPCLLRFKTGTEYIND
ncbi:MMPL family transporter [Maridesulfovibrio zosterae]|uniref:MMPL family transporter n=1 Tax=Maridesulfovibrio zosterae TaxID=82171 RepID=UPI000686B40C|nr:MMPL family transporter [Maridesulfovibrio zosterae]